MARGKEKEKKYLKKYIVAKPFSNLINVTNTQQTQEAELNPSCITQKHKAH